MRYLPLVALLLAPVSLTGQQVARYARSIETVADSLAGTFYRADPRWITKTHTHPDTASARAYVARMDSATRVMRRLANSFDLVTPPLEFVNADRLLRTHLATMIAQAEEWRRMGSACQYLDTDCPGVKRQREPDMVVPFLSTHGGFRRDRNQVAAMIRAAGGRLRDLPAEWPN